MINNPAIYKFFKYFTSHRKKTDKVVAFSNRNLTNNLKYRDHRWDLWTIWETRFLPTLIEELSCMYESSGSYFFHWRNTIRAISLWLIKVGYDLLNQFGSFTNIMQFQISSRRESRLGDAWVINIVVLRKDFHSFAWSHA